MSNRDIEFKIDAWTPDTLPQARLGLYLLELAKLYGEQDNVRFVKVRKGSAVLVSKVSEPARPKVERRLLEVCSGLGTREAVDAYKRLDDMLALDNATAVIRGLEQNQVVQFPGRDRPKPVEYGLIKEDGAIEGEIVRIGGRDQTIHVTLQDGETVYSTIETSRDMARQLGRLIFGPTVRLWGTGTWRRAPEQSWHLEKFVVARYEEVETTLNDAIDKLQAIDGSQWGDQADPVASLIASRQGDDEVRRS